MKKLILIAIAAFGVMQANAQFSINPEGGINFAQTNSNGDKFLTGYKIGAVANIDIAKGFYIEPGLFYSAKGRKVSSSITDSKLQLNYLEIPLSLGYRYDFGKAGGIFATAGPYLGIGLNGKSTTTVAGVSADVDMKAGKDFERMDWGMNLSVGYISPIGIYVRAQYGMGFTDVYSNVKNRVLGVSVGYAFQLNER
ncbi:MAG: porin family protein [Taibaiella sp.]|jgi:hypothetical protein